MMSVLLLRHKQFAHTFLSILYVWLQPELTVENLPSFLSLGKAHLLLFVGEEEDDIGLRQNQALVEEMKGVVKSGWRKMERYLASWIHLYVHQSAVIVNQYDIGFVLSPSIMCTNNNTNFIVFYLYFLFKRSYSSWDVCPGVIPRLYAPPPCSCPHPFALWR